MCGSVLTFLYVKKRPSVIFELSCLKILKFMMIYISELLVERKRNKSNKVRHSQTAETTEVSSALLKRLLNLHQQHSTDQTERNKIQTAK